MKLFGNRVRFVREADYVRKDGGLSKLWFWEITCSDCGAWFEFSQAASSALGNAGPELDLGRMTRRCAAHRPARRRGYLTDFI